MFQTPALYTPPAVVAKLRRTKTKMMNKINLIVLCVLFILGSCVSREPNEVETIEIVDLEEEVIKTPINILTLQNELDKFIDYDDSLKNARETHFGSVSFWIVFNKIGDDCYVSIIDHIGFYDSRIMVGYFLHREKYVSVYGNLIACGEAFIDKEKLSTGKIHYIIDFAGDNEGDRAPFPYQDFGYEYLIKGDSLILVKTGRVSRVPTQPRDEEILNFE
ncbi:MAG: hypothetical protein R6W68_14825 [Ignavibacteriaceae bacterium]